MADEWLKVENVGVRYGSCTVLDGVSFALPAGSWLMVIGPNGAGKSTLVGALTGGAPCTGSVTFAGEDVLAMKPAIRARKMGVLLQHYNPAYNFTVEEVVRLGRYAWNTGPLHTAGGDDSQKVEDALEITGLVPLRRQSVLTLSGGELQRTFLAQLLAQDPRVMLLDEPANHLDLPFQRQVFGMIGEWVAKTGRTAVSVVHDLSLARAYGTHALLVSRGRAVAFGKKEDVMTEENLNRVYGMDVGDWMRQMLGQWRDDGPAAQQEHRIAVAPEHGRALPYEESGTQVRVG